MKKSLFFVAALALVFASCENNEPNKALQVADFENLEIAEESVMHLAATGTFESGNFIFTQDVQDYGESGIYYFGNVPSNKTGNTYDFYADSDKSASGGAHKGKNFVVWTASYYGLDSIYLKEAAVVPGMYVNNTPWVVDAILHGDGMSDDGGKPFDETDFFTLTISGTLEGVPVNTEILVDLAYNGKYIKDWTYVSLKKLGKIDALAFKLSGSKQNSYGLTTPAYFAIDDLGARK